jgi:flagellin
MIIGHNLAAANAIRNTNANTATAGKSMGKLSSGLAITTAADDAAGLAISEKMKGQIRGLDQAKKNAQDGVSLVQTADGALTETTSILQRMRELANQSSNGSNTDADRQAISTEATQLTEQLDNIAKTTQFNTKNLLDGSLSAGTNLRSTQLESVALKGATTAAATVATTLIALADKDGNNFGLVATDVITITGKSGGTATIGATLEVSAANTLSALATAITTALDITSGSVTIDATGKISITGDNGVTQALTGVTLSAKDASGVARTSFNSAFSNLAETQTAQDNHTDSSLSLQIGANQGQSMSMSISNMDKAALGLGNIDLSNTTGATNAIDAIDKAITKVSSERSRLGAYQNRLMSTINNLGTTAENLTSAQSSVTDVDMAKEMSEYSKNNILSQASQAMLAQANQQPQQVLQLLK